MKIIAKSLILALLLAVICSATYIAVVAASDGLPDINKFSADEQMVQYGARIAPISNLSDDTLYEAPQLSGTRSYNIENAPALRVDNQVTIPRVTLEPADENDDTGFVPAPYTGFESYFARIAAATAMLGMSAVVAKGRRRRREV